MIDEISPAELCPSCNKSNTVEVTGDYKLETVCKLNGEPFTIPNITRTRCPECGDEFFFMSECEKIESAINAEQKMRNIVLASNDETQLQNNKGDTK
jgi:YgiT-type zinc finger domain-containing protein